jgi:hypothetical protein
MASTVYINDNTCTTARQNAPVERNVTGHIVHPVERDATGRVMMEDM